MAKVEERDGRFWLTPEDGDSKTLSGSLQDRNFDTEAEAKTVLAARIRDSRAAETGGITEPASYTVPPKPSAGEVNATRK
jgi:hypothetical protein